MINILIPIFVGPRNTQRDLERAINCVLSIESSIEQDFKLTILAPKADLPIVQTRFSRLKLKYIDVNFCADEDLLPPSIRGGWVKQQLLKLSFCARTQTGFTLILDSDIVCSRNFRTGDLLIGGKAMNSWEGRDLHEWYAASCAILGVAYETGRYGISVTPELLSNEICAALLEDLSSIYGKSWASHLDQIRASGGAWSEYSLYTIFAEKSGLLWKYHATPDEVFRRSLRMTSPMSRWNLTAFYCWDLSRIFLQTPLRGLFVVNQSSTNVSPKLAFRLACQVKKTQELLSGDLRL